MLTSIATIAVLVYLLFGLILYFGQKKFLYFPDDQDFDSCAGFKDYQKKSQNGTRFYFLKKDQKRVIVFYHGNAGSACGRNFLRPMLERGGHSIIFVEYTGYSGDKREPSKRLILKDVQNTKQFIEEEKFQKVTLVGESVGSGAATYHTSIGRVDRLLLLAPFSSVADLAKTIYSAYPVSLMLKENYDNKEWLRGYQGELTIIHGDKDDIIPQKLSKELFSATNLADPKKYILVNGAGHNDLFNFKQVRDEMKKFVDKHSQNQ